MSKKNNNILELSISMEEIPKEFRFMTGVMVCAIKYIEKAQNSLKSMPEMKTAVYLSCHALFECINETIDTFKKYDNLDLTMGNYKKNYPENKSLESLDNLIIYFKQERDNLESIIKEI
jgi:hypothetical protein